MTRQDLTLTSLFLLLLSNSVFAQRCELTAGWADWAPYQYQIDFEPVSGVDVIAVRKILNAMGCQVRFIKMPWHDNLQQIEDGSIDIAMGASILSEREKYAYFSLATRNESFILTTLSSLKINNITNLKQFLTQDVILGVTQGYWYGKEFEQLMQQAKFANKAVWTKSDTSNQQKLLAGEVNAILLDPNYIKHSRDPSLYQTHPQAELITGKVHIMFSKKNFSKAFVTLFNKTYIMLKTRADIE